MIAPVVVEEEAEADRYLKYIRSFNPDEYLKVSFIFISIC